MLVCAEKRYHTRGRKTPAEMMLGQCCAEESEAFQVQVAWAPQEFRPWVPG